MPALGHVPQLFVKMLRRQTLEHRVLAQADPVVSDALSQAVLYMLLKRIEPIQPAAPRVRVQFYQLALPQSFCYFVKLYPLLFERHCSFVHHGAFSFLPFDLKQ